MIKRAYLAGPMRGLPQYNFPAFHAAAASLRSAFPQLELLSPAEMDEEEYGAEQTQAFTDADVAKMFRTFMIRDLAAVLRTENVILLPGWEHSQGSRMEAIVGYLAGSQLWEYTEAVEAMPLLCPVSGAAVMGAIMASMEAKHARR